ncbi:MAG TPA: DUF4350 domain-containing protein [Steroidobacteraceae bacterium]|nr:DUF4350 domain-containing protein [Steroidobacteraceae bacterium]
MRERLTTLALACAALLLFLTLFVHAEGPPGQDASAPTTADRRANGLLGAIAWLKEEGVGTRAVRERLGALRRMRDLPPAGNLLIVTLPAAVPFANDEAVALDDWLRRGNTLLVLAALADRPLWAQDPGVIRSDLRLLTGFEIERVHRSRAAAAREGAAQALAEATHILLKPRRDTLAANRAHPFFENVRSVAGFSDYVPLRWKLKSPRDTFPLCLAHLDASETCGLWVLPEGAGSILLSAFGSLLSNRALGEADNARLLANLVRGTLGPDGVVLFDDEHQGLSDTYDAGKFWRDRRLYLTFGILAAVWLAWVVGGTRLAAPAAPAPAQGEADLVRATGAFLARVLRPSAAARRMFEHFFMRLRRTLREPTLDPSPYWEWLENNPRLVPADIAQLRAWYADAWSGRRVPLVRLHNLLVRTEMQIAA